MNLETIYISGMELVGTTKRTFAGIVIEMFWCGGLFILGGVAYFLRDWHYLQLACSVPTVLLFSFYWLVCDHVFINPTII